MTSGLGGGSRRAVMTVVFTDIVDSTATVSRLGDAAWRGVLDRHDAMLRAELRRYEGSEVTTTGDGICAVFESPGAALRFGRTVTKEAPTLGMHLRVGIHTGECEFRGSDLHGIAVHIASRVSDLAGAGEVLVTSTVQALVAGSGFGFEDRGEHELRGVPGRWGLRTVTATPAPVPVPPSRSHDDASRPSDTAPRVVVVDDHPLWRETLRGLVDRSRAAHVVGEASDGAEAVRVVTDAQADVVLMDMYLPELTGAEATASLRAAGSAAKVIMLSSADDRASVLAAVHAGASGYLLKTAAADDVLDAIRRVHRGEMVFPPQLTDIVLAALRRDAAETDGEHRDDDLAAFTRRERDVLALIAEGRSNHAISERLHLSTKSVEAYVAKIFTKLGLEPTAHDHRRVLAAVAYLRATGG